MSIVWKDKAFEELTPKELYSILQLRADVFVLEQTCLYRDLDDKDQVCQHIMGIEAETGALIAYSRVVPAKVSFAEVSIGRILTASSHRGINLGKELVRRSIALTENLYPETSIRIGAQAHLQAFYAAFGFESEGEVYDEDGIDHIEMVLTYAPKSDSFS